MEGPYSSVENLEDLQYDELQEHENEKCGCEIRCGYIQTKRYTFKYFESLNNQKGALLFFSIASFLQGAVVSGLYNINVSTLEKRFALRSSETGFLSSAYEIAGCLALPVFSYIGGSGHKPTWIGSGIFIMGLGSLIFSLPHFLASTYSIEGVTAIDCATQPTCGNLSMRVYRGYFIVGQMLMGIGSTPLYTLALSYLDENVEQVHSSTYHGIFYASSLLGPGIGYIVGGYLLTHFTTLEDPVGVSPESSSWIGNWWLGFLVVGMLYFILCIPIFLFPEKMPGSDKVRVDRENEMHQHNDALRIKNDSNFGKSLKDIPKSLLSLLKNSTLMLISFANALDSGMIIGIATFGPKYIESMFNISASTAAFYFGVLAITTASSAHVISGCLISKLKLSVKQMLRMSVVCAITAFACLFIFLYRCDNTDVAGVTVPYPGELSVECKQTECGCSTQLYRPVCGYDNLTYLSHCDAGCTVVDTKNFTNCTKMRNISKVTETSPDLNMFTAQMGPCQHNTCDKFNISLVFMGLAVFFTFMKGQTTLQSSIRIVPFSQRTITLGVQWLIIRLVGSTPMPIIYGKVLDISCIMWGVVCGECGSCHIYDNHTMSTYISLLNLSLKGVNICLLIAVYFSYNPPTENQTYLLMDNEEINEPERTIHMNQILNPVI